MVSPTDAMRKAWTAYECQSDKMKLIRFGPDTIRIAPETEEAWKALETVLVKYGYDIRIDDTDSYACREIKSGGGRSLHAYGIALDINWHTNPYLDHAGTRLPRFSGGITQGERAQDVKLGKADTDMTRTMVDAAQAIMTLGGKKVFGWGGDWRTLKDSMHFQIEVTPAQLAVGIDWDTVASVATIQTLSAATVTATQSMTTNPMTEGDIAMGLPSVFFSAVRDAVFQGSLTQSAVDNMNIIVDFWQQRFPTNPLNQLAYVLATVRREVGANMRPVRESFAASDAQARARLSNKAYAQSKGPYGHAYYGRGYVQLTWLNNYQTQGDKLGLDLVQFPDKVLETPVAVQILVNGMMAGDFNGLGHGLAHYVNSTNEDFIGARRTVNGQDHAAEIAGYARTFRDALRASNLHMPLAVAQGETPNIDEGLVPFNPFPDFQTTPDVGTNMGTTRPAGSTFTPSGAGLDPRLAALLAAFGNALDEQGNLNPAKLGEIIKTIVPQSSSLTPVNAMLGDTVGGVLNGRKTAIGVIGSLLFGLLGGSTGDPTAIAQNAGSVLGPLLQTLGGASPVALPVLAATTVWGILGKIDKWVRLKK